VKYRLISNDQVNIILIGYKINVILTIMPLSIKLSRLMLYNLEFTFKKQGIIHLMIFVQNIMNDKPISPDLRFASKMVWLFFVAPKVKLHLTFQVLQITHPAHDHSELINILQLL